MESETDDRPLKRQVTDDLSVDDDGKVCEKLDAVAGVQKADSIGVELKKELGRGAFGIVYEADLKVAVKVIRIGDVNTSDRVDDLINETRALSELQKSCTDYVVKTYDMILDTKCNELSIIMEKMPMNLEQYMNSFSEIGENVGRVLEHGLTHCKRGLKCIHSSGVFHRDIKPENILISGNGTFKFADFGLSCFQECTGLKGSVLYFDPVQIFESFQSSSSSFESHTEESVRAADIWALGMTFLNMMTYFLLLFAGIGINNADYWSLQFRDINKIEYETLYDGVKNEVSTVFETATDVMDFIFEETTTENDTGEFEMRSGAISFDEKVFSPFDYVFGTMLEEYFDMDDEFHLKELYQEVVFPDGRLDRFVQELETMLFYRQSDRINLFDY